MRFLLILFLIDIAIAVNLCPTKCICDKNAIRCTRKGLLKIPKVPTDVTILDVRSNNIQDVGQGQFRELRQLRSLLLNDNQLKELRPRAFEGLGNLVFLFLYKNKIQHIDRGVFDGLKNLEQLYLHLNEIHEIQPEAFVSLPKLERLYLHNNHIKRIPPGSFADMPKLQSLRLDSNALVCDCSMMWLASMMHEHKTMHVVATCYEPQQSTGTALAAMREEDFNCRQPELMAEPDDTIIDFGGDAIFTCMASGDPAPEIVWLHDSNKIPLNSHRYTFMNNGTLMVHNTTESDGGYFECVAKNAIGEVRSKPVKIQFRDENNNSGFITKPKDQIVKVGQWASFNCTASGNPTPHVMWLLNGERILLRDGVTVARNGTLNISNVLQRDVGTYTCQTESSNGKVNATATLYIEEAPVITTLPSNETVSVGETIESICEASAMPTPHITWSKNNIELRTGNSIIISDDGRNLTIVEATIDDSGSYMCSAQNDLGSSSATFELSVIAYEAVPPVIIVKPEDTEAYKENTIQLPCEVASDPPVTLHWRKDGSRIETGDRINITLIGSLVIYNLTILDSGSYECSVFNDYGQDRASAFLTVKDRQLPREEYINIALTEATQDIDTAIANTMEHLFKNNSETYNFHELFRISRYPSASARDIARAAEIYERTLHKVREYTLKGIKPKSTETFNYNDILSTKHLDLIARLSGCTAHREENDCSDMCYHGKYRSYDGSCNNFAHPMWGSSLTGFRRILPPIYENGFSEPVGWNKNVKYNGYSLPSARLVSTSIISTIDISQDEETSHMTMQWGQWLDHDLDHALPAVSSQTWDGIDCKKTCDYAAPCFPIDVPENDPRIKNRRCIDFIRTSSVCGSGMTSVIFGKLQAREQINQLTSYIDASQVYGFEKTVAEDLRDLTNENGLLRVGAIFPGKKPLLPTTGINGMDCRRNLTESTRNCFVAGDIRANEQIGLAAMHTIWMREHNRVARALKLSNPFWDGNRTYQEARKIVGAEMQFITYEHWLPLVLGSNGYEKLGSYAGYNRKTNPSVSNVFATAALRFGHSMINPVLHRYDENFEPIPQGHLALRYAFFSPWRMVDEGGVDPLIRGMYTTPAKLKTPTQNLNTELTERLFESAHAVALDLAAINVQRSRDHAIPPYTKWREFCNMSAVNTFDDLRNEISNEEVRNKLRDLYGSPHNIDVWVGGILEDQVEGGKVGPLFRCLLVEQFQRLRDGDRFWYEHPSIFKADQLEQIKQTSLARILCDNGDNIDTITENVFLLPSVQDGFIACEDLPLIDFRYWADCEECDRDDDDVIATQRVRRSVAEPDGVESLRRSQIEIQEYLGQLKNRIEYLEKQFVNSTCNNN